MKLFDESDKAIDETKMRQEEAKNPEEMLMNKEQDQKTIDLHTILIKCKCKLPPSRKAHLVFL